MGRLSNPPLAGGVRGSVIRDISVGAICDIVTNLVTANNVSGRWAFYSSVRNVLLPLAIELAMFPVLEPLLLILWLCGEGMVTRYRRI